MMTDNEIIKALECCAKGGHCSGCCPYDDDDVDCNNCTSRLTSDALDLINRQKAEIERLKDSIKEADEYFSEGDFTKGIACIINLVKEMVGE